MRHMVTDTETDGPVAEVDRVVWEGVRCNRGPDLLIREEPLEIRVNGAPVAVVMRTPGFDEDLVRGFLLTEGIVGHSKDIRSLHPCRTVPTPEAEGNVMVAVLAGHVPFDLTRFRRNLFSSSSCGVCGKATLEAVLQSAPPLSGGPAVERGLLSQLIPAMRRSQVLFDRTGGLHAAALFSADGELRAVREDIGRHNAVDKAVGAMMAQGETADILTVSGRVSFEIVQKALAARVPAVASVSAPSALAVELAKASHMTVVAFVRGERMVVYADPGRLVGSTEDEVA